MAGSHKPVGDSIDMQTIRRRRKATVPAVTPDFELRMLVTNELVSDTAAANALREDFENMRAMQGDEKCSEVGVDPAWTD